MTHQFLQKSLAMMDPRKRHLLAMEASRQGVTLEQAFLDEMLDVAGPLKEQLYSLRRQQLRRVA